MTDQERKTLDQMKKAITERYPFHRMVLFGSRARNEAQPDSNLDVLVVLPDPVEDQAADFVRDCAWEAGFDNDIVVVPITVFQTEWEDGPMSSSLLAMAIARDGIAL